MNDVFDESIKFIIWAHRKLFNSVWKAKQAKQAKKAKQANRWL